MLPATPWRDFVRCMSNGLVGLKDLPPGRLVGEDGTVLVDSKKLGLQNGVAAGVGGSESVSP